MLLHSFIIAHLRLVGRNSAGDHGDSPGSIRAPELGERGSAHRNKQPTAGESPTAELQEGLL